MTPPHLLIVRHPADAVAAAPSVSWAIRQLGSACAARGGTARAIDRESPQAEGTTAVLAGLGSPWGRDLLASAGAALPEGAESLALVPISTAGDPALVASGADARGLAYAVLELADRIEHAEDPSGALRIDAPIVERPVNRIRSVARLFCSEVEDKGWFHDEGFWHRYLSMLAAQRFNRFSLTLGLGYNYHRGVTDAYLYFAYPFLLSVPGYNVRVPQLPDEEREQNLAMLRFISEQATARGLDFQLGLWTHACEWIDSPEAHQTIEGLTPETHAAYCRDAVRTLLEACPAIGGLTFRIHGESGVPEGSFGFWGTVFEGVAACGRTVGIDLHAKGLDEPTLRLALDTGLPVTVSPKFWAEHMGLPYHQASIRERERIPREDPSHRSGWHRYMRVSEGSRPFTRYGYGDFLREDRPYDVVFRLWAGTQRLLLWGDPAFAAAYGRAAGICGAGGLEWCEPLTFKGREGSGVEGSRTGYADPSLVPEDDWEKYAYTYRLFGRLTYDPDAPAETWRRYLRTRFGSGAGRAEAALASASRILPLVTVAHHPSASNNYYWPEIYTDMPIVESLQASHPYLDTPEPRRFGTVSPLDPEVFSSVDAYVEGLLAEVSDGRASPIDVAAWLEQLAGDALDHLDRMGARLVDPSTPDVRRWSADVRILSALGRFFSGKLRAAVGYELHRRTNDQASLGEAVRAYRSARAAWTDAARHGEIYVADLTFGPQQRIRGAWGDRLAAVDDDLVAMERLMRDAGEGGSGTSPDIAHLQPSAERPPPDVVLGHRPPAFRHGADVPIALEVGGSRAASVVSVQLRYRPMDQSRGYAELAMERRGDRFVATIPGAISSLPYPLAYVFIVREEGGAVWRYPGLGEDLTGRPYVVAEGVREG